MSNSLTGNKSNGSTKIVNLMFNCQDRDEIVYRKFMTNKPLKNLMTAYCGDKSLDLNSTTFWFGDHLLHGNQTPDELEMKDEDEIRVVIQSNRGRSSLHIHEGSSVQSLVEHEENAPLKLICREECRPEELSCHKATPSSPECSFHRATRLSKDPKKHIKELLDTTIAAEKKAAKSKLIMERLCRENWELQRANAEILSLTSEKSRLAEKLKKAKKELIKAKGKIVKLRKENVKTETLEKGKMPVEASQDICIRITRLATRKTVYFQINRNCPLEKVMKAYCRREGVDDYKSLCFMFGGAMLGLDQTADEMQIKDGDEITVLVG